MKKIKRICLFLLAVFGIVALSSCGGEPKVEYPEIDIRAMGFPQNWQDEDLWK